MAETAYDPDPAGLFSYIDFSGTQAGQNAGSGSGGVDDGLIDPVAAPTDPSITNWYINTATGTAWVWPAGGAAWQQIV